MSKSHHKRQTTTEKAVQLLAQHRLLEAKPLYEQICRANKHDLTSWMDLGFIYSQQGDIQASADCFTHIIKQDPGVPEAYFNLGNAFKLLERFDEAEQCFKQAITLKPNWIQAFNNLGNLLQQTGQYENAALCYYRALKIEPRYMTAQVNHSNLMQLMGFYREAMEGYKTVLREKPDHIPALRSLCNVYILMSQLDLAMACCDRTLQISNNSAEFIGLKAKIYNLKGDKQAAYDLIEPLIEKHSDQPQIAYAFANVCHLHNRCDEALNMLNNILDESEGMAPEKCAELNFNIAKFYEKRKAYEIAFKHYDKGNKLSRRPYAPIEHERLVKAIVDSFSRDAFANLPESTIDTQRPIFIVGMVRMHKERL
ncbi:tetratricopeptide repeat protein [Pseudomonadota bacterium]